MTSLAPDPRAAASRWAVPDPRPGPFGARLLLLPHAGGGANTYRAWPALLPPGIEALAIQLPGRERRFGEAPLAHMDSLLDALVPAIAPLLDRPFAIFGHSMGACIGHALVHRLRAEGLPAPRLLIAAGHDAPTHARPRPPLHDLPEAAFLDALRVLGGTPPEVLANRELLDLLVPMLRADFALIASYRPAPARFDCPVLVLDGRDDGETTPEGLAAWRDSTTAGVEAASLPGGHFFPDEQRRHVLDLVVAALRRHGIEA
jgi:surfactin synthase thioesterase subunit